MSIFEKYSNESPVVLSQKVLAAWMIAADNEINAIDFDIYKNMFENSKDLKEIVGELNIGNNDIPEACHILSNYYIDKNEDAINFLNFMIMLSFSNRQIFPYEKLILDCTRKALNIEDIVLSNHFQNTTKSSFFPIGNASVKEWWESPESYYSDDFIDYYSILNLSLQSNSQEIRIKIQQNENTLSKQTIQNIEYVLLNNKRKEVYNKHLIYNQVIKRIFEYKGKDGKKDPIFVKKEHIKVKTNHIFAGSAFIIVLSLVNMKYDFVRFGVPDPQSIEITNKIEATIGSKEIIVHNDLYKVINTDKLHLRVGPGIENDVITILSKGDKVKILSESNGWSNVKYNDHITGWMATSHLSTIP